MAATASAQQFVFPTGLTANDVTGIYPAETAAGCCWLGASATMRIAPPRDARALLFNVFVPQFALTGGPQRLYVTIGRDRERASSPLSVGEHELVFTLPPGAQHSPLEVRLRAAYTFVPAQIGMNQDPRHLSVLVRAVGFATPDGYDNGVPLVDAPQLPPALAYTLLAIGGFLILALTVWRPVYGVCALLLTDPFLLAVYVHGTTLSLPKVALVAVALGIVPRIVRAKGVTLERAFILLLAASVAVIATMLLATIHAHDHGAALRETLKAVQYAATLAVAYAAYRLDPQERAIRIALLAIAVIVVIPALLQERGGASEWETFGSHAVARIAGPLGGPNQLAGFLGIVIPAIAAFWALRPRIVLETVAILLGVVACVLTFSRGGVVALMIALLVVAAIRYTRAPRKAIAATAIVYIVASALSFLVFIGTAPHAVAAAFGASESHEINGGLGNRFDLWRGAYAMWRAHPLFGIGPGNFEFAIGGYVPGLRTHANGMFFQTLAEQGMLGLLAFLGLTAASVGVFLRKLDNPLALGAVGASTALAFHQIVDCIVIYPKVGVIWCVLLGIAAASKTR